MAIRFQLKRGSLWGLGTDELKIHPGCVPLEARRARSRDSSDSSPERATCVSPGRSGGAAEPWVTRSPSDASSPERATQRAAHMVDLLCRPVGAAKRLGVSYTQACVAFRRLGLGWRRSALRACSRHASGNITSSTEQAQWRPTV